MGSASNIEQDDHCVFPRCHVAGALSRYPKNSNGTKVPSCFGPALNVKRRGCKLSQLLKRSASA